VLEARGELLKSLDGSMFTDGLDPSALKWVQGVSPLYSMMAILMLLAAVSDDDSMFLLDVS
jgi:hypothetical protein